MSEVRLGLFDLPEFGERLMPPERPRKNNARPIWRLGQQARKVTGAESNAGAGSAARNRVARFMRVVRQVPEVLVKVTGVNRDAGALQAHLSYLSRVGAKAEIEDENGVRFCGESGEMRRLVREWGVSEAENSVGDADRRRPVAAVHIVLSMPRGTDPQVVLDAVRGFADEELSNHRHLLVLHQDKNHPHVHVVVNNLGFDLKPLARNRDDLVRWREAFARELRVRSVEAEATPRKMRGVIKKPYDLKVLRAAQTSKRKYGDYRDARVYKAKVADAENARRGLGPTEPHPAEKRARENRALTEKVMGDAIS